MSGWKKDDGAGEVLMLTLDGSVFIGSRTGVSCVSCVSCVLRSVPPCVQV